MNDLSKETGRINDQGALERAAADYATVGDLIKEAEASIRNDDKIIEEARETIKAAQDHKRMSRDYIRLQTARRRVFANAKHRLQMIDEGL